MGPEVDSDQLAEAAVIRALYCEFTPLPYPSTLRTGVTTNSPPIGPGHPFCHPSEGRRENALYFISIFLVEFGDDTINAQWLARHEDISVEGRGPSWSTKTSMWR